MSNDIVKISGNIELRNQLPIEKTKRKNGIVQLKILVLDELKELTIKIIRPLRPWLKDGTFISHLMRGNMTGMGDNEMGNGPSEHYCGHHTERVVYSMPRDVEM